MAIIQETRSRMNLSHSFFRTRTLATAEALEVNAIISYDKKAFRNSPILSLTAQEACREMSD